MRAPTRLLAVFVTVLILPAALFMAALAARGLQPLQHEPAHTARLIVTWYAGRMWTLWLLLLLLPMAALLTGCATLLRIRSNDREPLHPAGHVPAFARGSVATVVVAVTTLLAAGILAIVVLHVLAN